MIPESGDLKDWLDIHEGKLNSHDDWRRVFKRWLTFKNIYMLSTDLVFLIALILRYYAYLNSQCRRGCPYQGNETAFIASAIWSVASLLTFLRIIQGGLMWRQTGTYIDHPKANRKNVGKLSFEIHS